MLLLLNTIKTKIVIKHLTSTILNIKANNVYNDTSEIVLIQYHQTLTIP